MKKSLIVFGVFLLALFQPLIVQKLSAQEIGRFQLLNAVVEVGGQKESVLFKIDTVTGNTWRYNQVYFKTTNGIPVGCDGWSSIGDYNENFNRLEETLKSPNAGTSNNTNVILQQNLANPK